MLFDRLEKKVLFSDIEENLIDSHRNTTEKADLLEEYLISTWIHGNSTEIFHDQFVEYVDTENDVLFSKAFKEYGFDDFGVSIYHIVPKLNFMSLVSLVMRINIVE